MTNNKALSHQAVGWLHRLRRIELPPVSSGARSTGEHLPTIPDIDQAFSTTTTTRLSAAVRLVACFAALHLIWGGYYPTRQQPTAVPLALLFLFTVYAGVLYWRTVRNSASQESQIICWLDALWYLAITGMTGGPSSHFSFFLPFPVLFISFRLGFAPGMTMAICSTSVLLVMGILSAGMDARMFATDILLPPVALLVLGYLIATWANSGLVLNRRLASLKEINSLFNPRLNIEQIMDRAVRHLAELYQVDKHVLVLVEAGSPPRVFRANLPDIMYRVSDTAAGEISNVLLELDSKIIVYRGNQGLRRADAYGLATPNAAMSNKQLTDAIAVAKRLDCVGFGSVQFDLHHGGTARLFVCANERSFGQADLPFFRQFAEQLSPRLENVQLLDRLANEVAEHERQKISRDIHDSAIQPYIGLKFALEALARKASPTDPLAKDIQRLAEMAQREIAELRRYVKGLRGQGEPGHAALVPALRRQAARFGELYGIKVEVEAAAELRVGDGLADDAFHMVSEALSNVRRHTTAALARINLFCDTQMFTLQIANPCDAAMSVKLFTPRSIAERAIALGGAYQVETGPGRDTVVTVEIPLRS